jgi:hypothetical protein
MEPSRVWKVIAQKSEDADYSLESAALQRPPWQLLSATPQNYQNVLQLLPLQSVCIITIRVVVRVTASPILELDGFATSVIGAALQIIRQSADC